MKEKRYYVRHLYGSSRTDEKLVWRDIYEVYTQPRKDYLISRLYHIWCNLNMKVKLFKLQDWVFLKTHDTGELEDMIEIPSIRQDLRCYDLGVKNQTVIAYIEKERNEP